MQIVWDQNVVEQLKQNHIVLELETLMIEGKELTAYCVVPAEKISLEKFSMLEAHKEMHAQFVDATRKQNYETCLQLVPFLMGEFGGELDSFYQTIVDRIKTNLVTS
jgi:hypothetical protein